MAKSIRGRWVLLLVTCLVLVAADVPAVRRGWAPAIAQARAPGEVALRAAGRGNPWLNLADGALLAVAYEGDEGVARALAAGEARPLALAADDFDEDGVPDLVAGYDAPPGLALHRGNVDAVYPDAPQARQRKAAGTFDAAPFLSPARVFPLPVAPEFVGSGDFDNDGHRDVVVAAREGTSLVLLAGDGRGGFRPAELMPLPGPATALLAGDLYLPDGLADLAVGVTLQEGGSALLVFAGPAGALRSEPLRLDAPAPVTGLALMNVDGSGPIELVAAAGHDLLVVGRGGSVERLSLPYTAVILAVGDFYADAPRRAELAVLDADGRIHLLDGAGIEVGRYEVPAASMAGSAPQLLRARLSAHPTDDLILLDLAASHLYVLNTQYPVANARYPTLDAASPPAAALPLRLTPDAFDDLVLLQAGRGAPVFAPTAPLTTFTVDTTVHSFDANPGDGICSDGLGRCSLYAAISEADAWPGADEIRFDLGPGIPTVEWVAGFPWPDINEAVAIRGDTGGATYVALAGGELVIEAENVLIRGLAIPEGIRMSGTDGAINDVVEGCQLGPAPEVQEGLLYISDSIGHQIGGTAEPARNVFLGNSNAAGIYVWGCGADWAPCQIQGNYVGLEPDGVIPRGNGGQGIYLRPRLGNYIVVGGTEAGAGNVVAATTTNTYGSGGDGIEVFYNNTSGQWPGPVRIQGNLIGTDARGHLGAGNGRHGVRLTLDAWYVTVGGAAVGAGNVIAGNRQDGVCVDGSQLRENPIRGNAIYANGDLPIDLGDDGPTANDPGDSDGGPNRLQNWPVVDGVTVNGGQVQVTFLVDSAPTQPAARYPLQIDFFAGDQAGAGAGGKVYLGSVEYLEAEARTWATKSFVPRAALPIPGLVVATATDADGNTSEFSTRYAGQDLVVTIQDDWPDANPGDGICADIGGECTLRAAIETANARAGGDVIIFDIPGTGLPVIEVTHALPVVAGPLCIDGTTQPEAGRVVLDGDETPSGTNGLDLAGGDSVLRGLAIAGFGGHGVLLSAGDGNTIVGSHIGALQDGVEVAGNGGDGVHIGDGSTGNVVGGLPPLSAVVLVGNGSDGIEIAGTDAGANQVLGSYIGTDQAGAESHGNAAYGVRISGSPDNMIRRNVISGNGWPAAPGGGSGGILLEGSTARDNLLLGNFVGTTVAGDAALANWGHGIYLDDAPANYLALNLVSGNNGPGILIRGGDAAQNLVVASYVGTDAAGTAKVGNSGAGIWIYQAPGNDIGITAAGAAGRLTSGNLISGNEAGGIHIFGKEASGNQVQGNVVGLDAAATAPLPNGKHGLDIALARDSRVEDNIIAGNGEHGIRLFGTRRSLLYSNYLGTNPAGAAGLGNGQAGVSIELSTGTEIGGPAGRGNVIGNNVTGIDTQPVSGGHDRIVHNLIGTDRAGASIPNEEYGLEQTGTGRPLICNNKVWYNGQGPMVSGGVKDFSQALICANSVRHNLGFGIHNEFRAAIQGNSVQDNGDVAGILSTSVFPSSAHENNIVGNTTYGLRTTVAPVEAGHNWWGDASGPGGQGPGSGDAVGENVDYEPWLASPVAVAVVPAAAALYSPPGSPAVAAALAQQATATTTLFLQNWSEPGDTLTVTLGDTQGWLVSPAALVVSLEDGLGASVPVSVSVPAGTPPGTVDEVTVTAVSGADPSADDSETFQVIAALTADLAVSLAGPDLATTLPYPYAITVGNDGPHAANNVVLTATLPVTATVLAAQAGQGTCTPSAGPPGVVVCQLGALAAAARAEVTITVVLTSTADAAVVSFVEVWADEHDDDPVDNFDVAYTPVGARLYLPLVVRAHVGH